MYNSGTNLCKIIVLFTFISKILQLLTKNELKTFQFC